MDRVNKLIDRYKSYVESREIYFNYVEDYETFSSSVLKHTRPILFEKNALFEFERKGNNREGALTTKTTNYKVAGVNIKSKKVKIRRDIDFVLQLSTYFHELVHLINDHNARGSDAVLSSPQKEYVAEVTSQALMYSFVGGIKVEDFPSNNKWDHTQYIYNWIRNAKFSEAKINEMWNQIETSYNKIREIILEKTNKIEID